MTDALNPEPLLRALHQAEVQHIIIGGFAVNAHGVIRPSRDLDIVPDPDPANLERLAALLADLDARSTSCNGFQESTRIPHTAHSRQNRSKASSTGFPSASAGSGTSSR